MSDCGPRRGLARDPLACAKPAREQVGRASSARTRSSGTTQGLRIAPQTQGTVSTQTSRRAGHTRQHGAEVQQRTPQSFHAWSGLTTAASPRPRCLVPFRGHKAQGDRSEATPTQTSEVKQKDAGRASVLCTPQVVAHCSNLRAGAPLATLVVGAVAGALTFALCSIESTKLKPAPPHDHCRAPGIDIGVVGLQWGPMRVRRLLGAGPL